MTQPLFSVALNTLTRTLADDDLRLVAASKIQCLEVAARMFDNDLGDGRKSAVKAMARQGGPRVYSLHAGDLDLSALHHGVHARAIGEAVETIELAKELGAAQIVFHPSDDRIEPSIRPYRIAQSIDAFKALAPEARRCGVKIAIEALPRTCLCNTADELSRILEPLPTDVVGVCIDTNHLMANYRSLCDTIVRFKDRLLEIHCSDYDGIDERHALPGTGVVDWSGVMQTLRGIGFDGPLNYEVVFRTAPPLDERIKTLEENYRWLSSL